MGRETSTSIDSIARNIVQDIVDKAIWIYDIHLDQRVMDIIDEKFPSWGADTDGKISTSSLRDGYSWSSAEDKQLSKEVSLAITRMASRYRRSREDIERRIRQRGLI